MASSFFMPVQRALPVLLARAIIENVAYPPDDHVLRDLRATSWLEAEDHAVAEMPVDVAVLDASGAASLGALATLVDLCCARVAFHAAAGSWIATADLSLHLTQPVPVGGTARVDAWLLK